MNMEEICQKMQQEKINRDMFDSDYLSSYDYDICNYIIDYIPMINFPLYRGEKISKRRLFKESLKQFKNFDNEDYQRLAKIIRSVKIKKDYPSYIAGVSTSFNIKSNSCEKEIITPGYTSGLHISKNIYDIDIVNLGHEYCHLLKEANLSEHKNSLVLGEVIPIFYEFINYEDDFLRQKHLQYRLYWLSSDKNFYIYFSEELEDILHDESTSLMNYDIDEIKELYEFARSSYGGYLLGFYYASILYNMYRDDPIYVLSYIRDVLNHKITTLEMLTKLNIYCDIRGEIFEKEFNKMKKVLTR